MQLNKQANKQKSQKAKQKNSLEVKVCGVGNRLLNPRDPALSYYSVYTASMRPPVCVCVCVCVLVS